MDEIKRAPANLVVHTTTPLNAEPAMDRLVASFITPQTGSWTSTPSNSGRRSPATSDRNPAVRR